MKCLEIFFLFFKNKTSSRNFDISENKSSCFCFESTQNIYNKLQLKLSLWLLREIIKPTDTVALTEYSSRHTK